MYQPETILAAITKPIKNVKTLSDAYLFSFIGLTLLQFFVFSFLLNIAASSPPSKYLIIAVTSVFIMVVYFIIARNLGDSIDSKTCFLMPAKTMIITILILSIIKLATVIMHYSIYNSLDLNEFITPFSLFSLYPITSCIIVGLIGVIGKLTNSSKKPISIPASMCIVLPLISLYLTFNTIFKPF